MSKLLTTRSAVLMHDPVENGYRVAATRNVKTLGEGTILQVPEIPEDTVLTADQVPEKLLKHGLVLAAAIRFGSREIGILATGKKSDRRTLYPVRTGVCPIAGAYVFHGSAQLPDGGRTAISEPRPRCKDSGVEHPLRSVAGIQCNHRSGASRQVAILRPDGTAPGLPPSVSGAPEPDEWRRCGHVRNHFGGLVGADCTGTGRAALHTGGARASG